MRLNQRKEEGVAMDFYEAGSVYHEAVGHQEGTVFDIDDGGIVLKVYMGMVTEHEADQFKSGMPFEMKLVQLRNIIFPVFKFGDMNWMDASYSVHLSRGLTKLEMPLDGSGLAMTVHLFDTVTGELLCNRLLSLSTEMSRKLVRMVEEQKMKPFNESEHRQNIAAVYMAYPTKKLLKMATCSFRLR